MEKKKQSEEKIVITADSCLDITKEMIAEHGIKVIPMSVILGDVEKKDGVECSPDDIYAEFEKTKEVPKTTAISRHDFEQFFKTHTQGGAKLIHFSLSDGLSASYNNAVAVAKEMKNVYVVNTLELSMGIGLCAMLASWQRAKGKTAEQIVEYVNANKHNVKISFIIDTLKFLHKGGRCSALKRFMSIVLNLKPEIIVKDEGKMDTGKKYMGKLTKVLENYTDDTIAMWPKATKKFAFITHTVIDPEIVKMVEQKLKLAGFETIYDTMAGSTITCHCGKNCLGIGIYNGEIE